MSGNSIRLSRLSGDNIHKLAEVNQGGVHFVEIDYEGEYEVTPTQSEQVLSTANKTLMDDVVINPIPSNYGLITWNGATLTVS